MLPTLLGQSLQLSPLMSRFEQSGIKLELLCHSFSRTLTAKGNSCGLEFFFANWNSHHYGCATEGGSDNPSNFYAYCARAGNAQLAQLANIRQAQYSHNYWLLPLTLPRCLGPGDTDLLCQPAVRVL